MKIILIINNEFSSFVSNLNLNKAIFKKTMKSNICTEQQDDSPYPPLSSGRGSVNFLTRLIVIPKVLKQ